VTINVPASTGGDGDEQPQPQQQPQQQQAPPRPSESLSRDLLRHDGPLARFGENVAPPPSFRGPVDNLMAHYREREAAMQRAAMVAANNDPDEYAKGLTIGKLLGMPSSEAGHSAAKYGSPLFFHQLEHDLRAMDHNRPQLAAWLRNVDNAAVSSDDLDTLEKLHDSIVFAGKERSWFGEMWEAGENGLVGVQASYYHLAGLKGMIDLQAAAEGAADANRRIRESREGQSIGVQRYFQRVGRAKGALDTLMVAFSDPSNLGIMMADSLGFSAPSLVMAAAVGKAGAVGGTALGTATGLAPVAAGFAVAGGLAGAAVGAMAGGTFVEMGAWINQTIEETIDPTTGKAYDITDADSLFRAYSNTALMERAQAEGLRKGLTIGAVDAASIFLGGRFLRAAAGKGRLAKVAAYGKEGVTQGAMEGAGEGSSLLAVAGGDVLNWTEDDWAEWRKQMAIESAVSLGPEAGHVLIGYLARKPLDARERKMERVGKALQAEQNLGALLAAGEAYADSKTAGRNDGDEAGELVDTIASGAGVSILRWDKVTWDEFFTSRGLSPGEALAEIVPGEGPGSGIRMYHDAHANGEIRVSLRDLLKAKASTEEYAPLVALARSRHDLPSPVEAEEVLAEHEHENQEVVRRFQEERTLNQEAEDIRDKLAAAEENEGEGGPSPEEMVKLRGRRAEIEARLQELAKGRETVRQESQVVFDKALEELTAVRGADRDIGDPRVLATMHTAIVQTKAAAAGVPVAEMAKRVDVSFVAEQAPAAGDRPVAPVRPVTEPDGEADAVTPDAATAPGSGQEADTEADADRTLPEAGDEIEVFDALGKPRRGTVLAAKESADSGRLVRVRFDDGTEAMAADHADFAGARTPTGETYSLGGGHQPGLSTPSSVTGVPQGTLIRDLTDDQLRSVSKALSDHAAASSGKTSVAATRELRAVSAEAQRRKSEAAPAETDDGRVSYDVEADRLEPTGDIAASYSGDTLAKGKVNKPFTEDGSLWLATEVTENKDGQTVAKAYQLTPANEWTGETVTYDEAIERGADAAVGLFHGVQVKAKTIPGGDDAYVMTGPPADFAPEAAAPAAPGQSTDSPAAPAGETRRPHYSVSPQQLEEEARAAAGGTLHLEPLEAFPHPHLAGLASVLASMGDEAPVVTYDRGVLNPTVADDDRFREKFDLIERFVGEGADAAIPAIEDEPEVEVVPDDEFEAEDPPKNAKPLADEPTEGGNPVKEFLEGLVDKANEVLGPPPSQEEGATPTAPPAAPAPDATLPDDQAAESPEIAEKVKRTVELADRLDARLVIGHKDGAFTPPAPMTWQELQREAATYFGGTQAEGAFTSQDLANATEFWLNRRIARYPNPEALRFEDWVALVRSWSELIPTQTRRTDDKVKFQQFSTPSEYAAVIAWVANVTAEDVALEPSAGTGNIAAHAKVRGAAVVANEIDPMRAALLRALEIPVIYNENAEQISNILPDINPTVVVMNPPFSSSGTRNKKDTMIGSQHIDQALKMLRPGGRLVAIVGGGQARKGTGRTGMAFEASSFRGWWKRTMDTYTVRANVGVAGKVYSRLGTSFPTRVLVIDKTGPTANPESALDVDVETLGELITALEDVRDARPEVDRESGRPSVEAPGDAGSESGGRAPDAGAPVARPGSGGGGVQQPGVRTDTGDGDRGPAPAGGDGPASGDGAAGGPADAAGSPGAAGGGQATGGATAQPAGGDAGGLPASDDAAGAAPSGVEDTAAEESPQDEALIEKGAEFIAEADDEAGVFDTYAPAIAVKGASPHPSPLVESAAMASVSFPEIKHDLRLSKEAIAGASNAQLETAALAGQAFEVILPNGKRQGFFAGDGTGVGKTREIIAILMDNMNHGRKRHVWVSASKDLYDDAVREWGSMGGDPALLMNMKKVKANTGKIPNQDGVVFVNYDTLKVGAQYLPDGEAITDEGKVSRLDQIREWLGTESEEAAAEFDGVIVFDESHKMGSAIAQKKGGKGPSATALSGLYAQDTHPLGRLVYASATGATEVHNLAYAERLGLWGEGTAFGNVLEFVAKIGKGGLATMEQIARELKQRGLYTARAISMKGVKYERLEHNLTDEQTTIYNRVAEAWQIVHKNMVAATQITEGGKEANKRWKGQYWGLNQRFFDQIMTSMAMPSTLKQMHADIDAGHSVVIQLINHYGERLERLEAERKRQVAAGEIDEEASFDYDLSPKGDLIEMVKKAFPVQQYEEVVGPDGKPFKRPVTDSEGKPVLNQEAVRMRDELLLDLDELRIPLGPVDMIYQEFGSERVGEITGRKQRVEFVDGRQVVVKRKEKAENKAAADDFMGDRIPILIFTKKGGTGRSYHADLGAKNQRLRRHYVVQSGWIANDTIQGLGRTHRTNQAQPPEYILVQTDLPGHKRFVSSIARRIEQLGALTKGQRDAGASLFTEADNLEGAYGNPAVRQFINNIVNGRVDGIEAEDLVEELGITGILTEAGNVVDAKVPEVPKFLNRILSTTTDRQTAWFEGFNNLMVAMIADATQNGTLDTGMQTLRAKSVKVNSVTEVRKDDETKAKTELLSVTTTNDKPRVPWEQAQKRYPADSFWVNNKSGFVWSAGPKRNRTTSGGNVEVVRSMYGPGGRGSDVMDYQLSGHGNNWTNVTDEAQLERMWTERYDKTPATEETDVHLLTGMLLPIWDRLPDKGKVYRITMPGGTRVIGREIPERDLSYTLERLGVGRPKLEMEPAELGRRILAGDRAVLSNNWVIQAVTAAKETRIEVAGPTFANMDALQKAGVFIETHGGKRRYFVPTGPRMAEALEAVLLGRDIMQVGKPRTMHQSVLAGESPFPKREKPTRMGQEEAQAAPVEDDKEYPQVRGGIVDGLEVGEDIPNASSISASLGEDYEEVGVREIPMSDFSFDPQQLYYGSHQFRRAEALAEEIRESGRIDPLIVVQDGHADGPYLLEGQHRAGALHILGKTSFPALVVRDLDRETITRQQGRGGTGGPRGATTYFATPDEHGRRAFTVAFYENANRSTFFHEMGHVWLEAMGDLAEDPEFGDAFKDDWTFILSFLNVTSRAEIGEPEHEKFADAFMFFVLEGKSPSARLRPAFASAERWLIRLFRNLDDKDIDLNDDMRGIAARLLATDDEIAAAEYELGGTGLSDEILAGMDEADRATYLKHVAAAGDIARAELGAQVLHNEARAAAREEKMEEFRAKAAKRVDELPESVVLSAMAHGTMPDGSPLPEGLSTMKLDKASVVEALTVISAETGQPYVRSPKVVERLEDAGVLTNQGGVPVEQAAEEWGFGSGDEMARRMSIALDKPSLVETMAQQELGNEFPELLGTRQIRTLRRKAVANEERVKQLEDEHRELQRHRRAAVDRIPSQAEIKASVLAFLRPLPISALQPQAFLSAAGREGNKSAARWRVGDWDGAAEAKRLERWNLLAFIESTKMLTHVERQSRWLSKAADEKGEIAKTLNKAGHTYFPQVMALLERFSFVRRSGPGLDRLKSLRDWVEGQRKQAREVGDFREMDIPEKLLDEAFRKNYRDMTVEELADLYDAVASIHHVAKNKVRMLKAKQKRTLLDIVKQIVPTVKASKKAIVRGIGARNKRERAMDLMDDVWAGGVKAGFYARAMDGDVDGGPMASHVVARLNKAVDVGAERLIEVHRALVGLYKASFSKEYQRKINRREVIAGLNLSREDVMSIAGHFGNPQGRQRLLMGLSKEQLAAVLQTMTAAEWQFVQGRWDLFESFWAEIEEQHARLTGVRPRAVEHLPFTMTSSDGIEVELSGGYMPLMYSDTRPNATELDEWASETYRGSALFKMMRLGFTKTRKEHVDRALRLDRGVVTQHLADVVHALSVREAVLDVRRILGNKDVHKIIEKHYGPAAIRKLNHWVTDVAAGSAGSREGLEKVLAYLRYGTVIARLGFRLVSALKQWYGLRATVVRIGDTPAEGAHWIGVGVKRWLFHHKGSAVDTPAWVMSVSSFMKGRLNGSFQRELNEMRQEVQREFMNAANEYAFWMLARMQFGADLITWLAQYEKTMSEMGAGVDLKEWEAEAIQRADQAVKDTQGGGQSVDLSWWERGNPLLRVLTTFFTDAGIKFNLTRLSAQRRSFKGGTPYENGIEYARFLADLSILYFTTPAVVALAAMAGLGDDDDPDEIMERFIRMGFGEMADMVPILREASGPIQGYPYRGPAGLGAVQTGIAMSQQIGQGKLDKGLWKNSALFAGNLFHWPTGALVEGAEAFEQMLRGDAPSALLGFRDYNKR